MCALRAIPSAHIRRILSTVFSPIFIESSVPAQFDKIGEKTVDNILRIWALGMARKAHMVESLRCYVIYVDFFARHKRHNLECHNLVNNWLRDNDRFQAEPFDATSNLL